ncbi:MAG: Cellulophaga phage phi13:2 [Pseudomonadota bacterium]|jgi:NTP pyrophosphatase (non-canonical NTP hydrolase)
MNTPEFTELALLIQQWARDRKILWRSNPKAQAMKTLEKCGELLEAATALHVLDRYPVETMEDKDWIVQADWRDKYRDAVGDVLVTIIIGCALADVDPLDCLAAAYDEIKDRKGHMNEAGIFVKDQPQMLALPLVGEAK